MLRLRSRQGLRESWWGATPSENERVTFGEAHPEDLWLHARGVPRVRAPVVRGRRGPSEETVRAAAQLAAYHSGARGERAVDVIVTRRRCDTSVRRAARWGRCWSSRKERVVTVPGELPAVCRRPAPSRVQTGRHHGGSRQRRVQVGSCLFIRLASDEAGWNDAPNNG